MCWTSTTSHLESIRGVFKRTQTLWHTLCSRNSQHSAIPTRRQLRLRIGNSRLFVAPGDTYPVQWTTPHLDGTPPVGPSFLLPDDLISMLHPSLGDRVEIVAVRACS